MNIKLFVWILIIAVAILVSAVIIFPVVGFSSYKEYLEEPEIIVEQSADPNMVVEDFYTWYLESFGNRAEGSFQNPLTDQAYQDSEYLTDSFIGHIDKILADFNELAGHDPFLCAQDFPQEMKTDGTFLHGGLASVIVRSDFPNHFATVDLQKNGFGWQISNITCANNPAGIAKAFYTWYLAYIGDRSAGEMRNPLIDRAYQEAGFLSAGFIQELDDLTADGISIDPILLAQDVPQDFSVDLATEGRAAIVHLQFGSETVQHLKVSMIEENGVWKISGVTLAK